MQGTAGKEGLNSSPLDPAFFTSVILKHFATLSSLRTNVIHNPRSGLFGNEDRMNTGSSEELLLD